MPIWGGTCSSSFVHASSPPAEAPIPTIRNDFPFDRSCSAGELSVAGLIERLEDGFTGAAIALFLRFDLFFKPLAEGLDTALFLVMTTPVLIRGNDNTGAWNAF